jgi:HSP20 family molecular chaperone IbpA
MAPSPTAAADEEANNKVLPIKFHGPFFHDAFFKSSRDILEKDKSVFESLYDTELAIPPYKATVIDAPNIVDSENQFCGTVELIAIEPGNKADLDNLREYNETSGNYEPQYQVILDIEHFSPHEVKVTGHFSEKEGGPSTLTIQGKHEEKSDPIHHGIVSRAFTRNCTIPSDVQLDKIECNMSSDGILQIVLPQQTDEGLFTKMKHRLVDPVLHVLPDFHMAPFWHRFMHKKLPPLGVQNEDEDTYRIVVDVKQFEPEEIRIEATEIDVRIAGMHKEKQDEHGILSREFCRIYDLPKNVNADQLSCELLPGGILEISGPKSLQGLGSCPGIRRLPLTVHPEFQQEREQQLQRVKEKSAEPFSGALNWVNTEYLE